MDAVEPRLDERGRCRSCCLVALLNEGTDHDTAQEQAKDIFRGKLQFVCTGLLPVRDNGTLYPIRADFPEDAQNRAVLFYLKKYDAQVRIHFHPQRLNFQRGDHNDLSGLWTAPRSGRGDFVEALVKRITKHAYRAVDTFGNELILEEQLAEKNGNRTTRVVTQISKRQITSFNEVLATNPLLAYKDEKKVRRFIQLIDNKHNRFIDFPGFRPISDDQTAYEGRARQVYELISFFQNNKLVANIDHKKISGLYIHSATPSLGKSSLLNVIQKLVYSFKHCLSDLG